MWPSKRSSCPMRLLMKEYGMRPGYWSLLAASLLLVIAAAGCAGPSPAAAVPTQAAPAASSTQPAGTVSASAVVEPAHKSSLGFLIGAPVKQVSVKAGDKVTAGQ